MALRMVKECGSGWEDKRLVRVGSRPSRGRAQECDVCALEGGKEASGGEARDAIALQGDAVRREAVGGEALVGRRGRRLFKYCCVSILRAALWWDGDVVPGQEERDGGLSRRVSKRPAGVGGVGRVCM